MTRSTTYPLPPPWSHWGSNSWKVRPQFYHHLASTCCYYYVQTQERDHKFSSFYWQGTGYFKWYCEVIGHKGKTVRCVRRGASPLRFLFSEYSPRIRRVPNLKLCLGLGTRIWWMLHVCHTLLDIEGFHWTGTIRNVWAYEELLIINPLIGKSSNFYSWTLHNNQP